MANILYYLLYIGSLPFILICIGSFVFYLRRKNTCFIVMFIASFIAFLNSISRLIWQQSVTYDMNNKVIAKSEPLLPFYMHWFIEYAMLLVFASALLIYALNAAKCSEQKSHSANDTE